MEQDEARVEEPVSSEHTEKGDQVHGVVGEPDEVHHPGYCQAVETVVLDEPLQAGAFEGHCDDRRSVGDDEASPARDVQSFFFIAQPPAQRHC